MGMSVVADGMEQIGTVLVATSAVGFVLSLGRGVPVARRPRLAGLLVASLLFLAHAVIAHLVASGAFPARADVPVLAWMVQHRTAPLDRLFTAVSAGGGTGGMAVLATVAAVAFWMTRRRRAAVGTVGAALVASLLVVVFKNLYGRTRPPLDVQLVPQTSLSFPSGHALGSVVVIGTVALLVASGTRSRGLRSLLAVLAVAAVGLVGLSRLYLGVHWLSDVLAGWSLGGAWLALCAVILLPRRPGIPPGPRTSPEGKGSDNAPPASGRTRVVPAAPGDHTGDATKEKRP